MQRIRSEDVIPIKPREIRSVLVTGSDGYIGSVLMEKLRRQGYQAVGLDTLYFDSIVLGGYTRKYPLIKSDIRSLDNLDLRRFDAIIHLAALSNDALGQLNPDLTEQINFRATIALAQKAKKSGVKRFIFSSSCSIYGRSGNEAASERSPVHPLTAYAQSKIAAERALRKLANRSFCVGILRNATVYGYSPKFRDDLMVNNLVASAVVFKQIRIHSDGTPWRPLIDVRDLSIILIKLLEAEASSVNGKIINIGFDQNNMQVKTVVALIADVLLDCSINSVDIQERDTRSYRVNFGLFHRLFPHVTQQWPLEKSIRDMIRQLQKNYFSRRDVLDGKFTRIIQLKKLKTDQKIDEQLFWKKHRYET